MTAPEGAYGYLWPDDPSDLGRWITDFEEADRLDREDADVTWTVRTLD